MKPSAQRILLTLICINVYLQVAAQEIMRKDSLSAAYNHALDVYQAQSDEQLPVFNSTEYSKPLYSFTSGSAFFLGDTMRPGKVLYDGVWFDNVNLLFDDYHDQLITFTYLGKYFGRLVKSKVSAFEIDGHRFYHRMFPSSVMDSGYYERVHQGPRIQVSKKVRKQVQDKIFFQYQVEYVMESQVTYYLEMEGVVRSFRGRKDFLSAFGADRREVSRHLKAEKFDWTKDRDAFVVEACRYYEREKS